MIPKGTVLLTKNGWEKIEDINNSDKILSEDGKYYPIKNIYHEKYSGYFFKIKTLYCLPVLLTPKHKITVSHVKKVRVGSKLEPKNIEFLNKEVRLLRNNEYLIMPILLENHNYKHLISFLTKNKRIDVNLNDEISYILGRYTGDGCSTVYKRKNGFLKGASNICFGINELNELRSCVDILIKNGFNVHVYKGKTNVYYLNFSFSYILSNFLEKNIGKKQNRKIPFFIFEHSNVSIIKNYIQGLLDADGCNHKGYYILTTSSIGLALQFQLLLTKLNILSFIEKKYRKGVFGDGYVYKVWVKNKRIRRCFIKYNNKYLLPIKSIEKIYIKNIDVFDIELKNNKSYLVSNLVCGWTSCSA